MEPFTNYALAIKPKISTVLTVGTSRSSQNLLQYILAYYYVKGNIMVHK
jgi:hypothetical protein